MIIYDDIGPDYMISKELLEIYNCDSLCAFDEESKMCIWINPPYGKQDYYFKVFDNHITESITKCARISLLKPEYIRCSDNPEWFLNEEEKKCLMKLLSKQYNKYFNIWGYLLYEYKIQSEFINYDYSGIPNFESLPMPDYMKLEI